MTSHEIRKDLNLTQEEFAYRFNIPLGTVRNWDARGCMPIYIYNILSEYKSILNLCTDLESAFSNVREIYENVRDTDGLHIVELDRYYDFIDWNL